MYLLFLVISYSGLEPLENKTNFYRLVSVKESNEKLWTKKLHCKVGFYYYINYCKITYPAMFINCLLIVNWGTLCSLKGMTVCIFDLIFLGASLPSEVSQSGSMFENQ